MWAYPPYPYLGHKEKEPPTRRKEMHALMLEGYMKQRIQELHREASVWRLARSVKKHETTDEPRTPLVRQLHRPSLVS